MKFTLITLASVAAVLGIITYFALFSGPQIIQPNQTSSTAQNYPQVAPSSTRATSSAFAGGGGLNGGNSSATGTSSGAGGASSSSSQVYQTTFFAPYPITWSEGQPQLAIMGAMLQADQLVLSVNIQMGPTAQCVPVNLRLITDEQGDMQAPSAPAAPNFPLAADGTCQGDAETSYNESVTFTVNPATGAGTGAAAATAPWLFSTGDPANGFFEIATTTAGGLQVTVPQKNG